MLKCAVKLGLATSPLGPLALINKFNKGVKSTLRLNPLTFDVVKGLFSTSHADLPKPHVIRYSVTSGPGIAVQIWRILAVALLNLPSPGYLVSPPLRSHNLPNQSQHLKEGFFLQNFCTLPKIWLHFMKEIATKLLRSVITTMPKRIKSISLSAILFSPCWNYLGNNGQTMRVPFS